MKGRMLAGATLCAASLALLGLPAAASAGTKPASPSSTGSQAYLQKLQARGEKDCIQPPANLSIKTVTREHLGQHLWRGQHLGRTRRRGQQLRTYPGRSGHRDRAEGKRWWYLALQLY